MLIFTPAFIKRPFVDMDQCMFLGNCPPTPPQNLTFTLPPRLGQNVRFGEGWVGSFPETYIDPSTFYLPAIHSYDLL